MVESNQLWEFPLFHFILITLVSGDDHMLQKGFWAWTLAKALAIDEHISFYDVFVAQLLFYHHSVCTCTPQTAPSRSCCRPLRWTLLCVWRHLLADFKPTENNKSLSVDNGAINWAQLPTDGSRLRTQPVFEIVLKRLSICLQRLTKAHQQEVRETICFQAVRPTKPYLPL